MQLTFQPGDVLVSLEPGPVQWWHPDGLLERVLVSTVVRTGDRLRLTFGTGTVQTFTRLGPGRGEQVRLDRGALALVDGRFVLVAEAQNRASSGSGSSHTNV